MEYKADSSNIVADALSLRDAVVGTILAISGPRFDFVDRLRQAHELEPALVVIKEAITANQRGAPWSLVDGLVAF